MLRYEIVSFDSVLNALWLLLGIFALAVTWRVTRRRNSSISRRRIWQSCAVVGLIAATLFPVFSATDDVLRIQNVERQHAARDAGSRKPVQRPASDTLIRLYEAMDMPLIAVVSEVVFTLLFAYYLNVFLQSGIDRANPSASGRSPPVIAS